MLNSRENQHGVVIQWCSFCMEGRLKEEDVAGILVAACRQPRYPAGVWLIKSRISRAVLMSSKQLRDLRWKARGMLLLRSVSRSQRIQ